MAFLAAAQLIGWIAPRPPSAYQWLAYADLWLYPLKTVVVLILLIHYWPCYVELKIRPIADHRDLVWAVAVGLLVYLAWVRMDWPWAMQGDGKTPGYDPFRAGTGPGLILAAVRLLGASIVVPMMEELFWRSFLLRYLISSRFESVRLGTLTPFAFGASVILFGLEHDLWLAGMLAGGAYTLLLYHTGRLWPCIVAHAVTNLVLGIHVLLTGEWSWW